MYPYKRTGRIFCHLSLADNKADLAHFLSEELCSQAHVDKEIVVAGGFRDELEVKSSTGATDLGPLKSTHEEGDTKLVLHAVHSQCLMVVVFSRDTDVLLLLVSHFQRMQCQHLWMKSGTSKKRRYIPINAVFNKLPSGSASSLLAVHALTGCDTTSYIANHTKPSGHHGRPSKKHHGLLKNLGIGELTDDTIQYSETFVCKIYNVYRTDSIDAARHLLFSKRGKPEAMAPTSDAPRFHLKRVHYQSMIWLNAHCPTPELPVPSEMGWRLVDSEQQPVLMTLSPIPVASRWSHVHVVNSARLVAANARSQDCDAHQCVHASIRRMLRRLA